VLALENNWPVSSIDFKAIPRRIVAMQLQISSIVFDRKSREGLYMWKQFEHNLTSDGWNVVTFSRIAPGKVPRESKMAKYARPG
jgi:hypothetical protein